MAFHYKTQGIILKKQDSGEANCIFKVCTKEYGNLTLFATSIRKSTSKLRGGLELFSLSQLEFVQGKQKKVLVEAIPLEQYSSIRQDFERLKAAFKIIDLIEQTITGQEKDEKIWESLQRSLSLIEQGASTQMVYRLFSQSLFSTLGYHSEAMQKSQTP